MSATVLSDTIVMEKQPPVTAKLAAAAGQIEVEAARCDCCGLTEECTPGYIERIRERYQGKWICGLCGEAVKDEIVRCERLISTEEALNRHFNFCKKFSSGDPPADPTVRLISAMRRILRRSLSSRSMPSSPMTKDDDLTMLSRSDSCIPCLSTVDESRYITMDEDDEE